MLRYAGIAFVLLFSSHTLAATKYIIKYRNSASDTISILSLNTLGLQNVSQIPSLNMVVAETNDEARFKRHGLPRLQALPEVEYVEKDFYWYANVTPNDPMWVNQSQMKRLGMEQAWKQTKGSSNVVVAVSDSGVWYDHEDLAGRIWANTKEIPGNGKDDDNNGFVDDIRGWDFSENDNDPKDEHGHGTHVSGIIGAAANNAIGMAGVNWQVKIMPVQFLSPSGRGSNSNGIKSIVYAVDNGAHIINCSWGGVSFSRALLDALNYAHSKNVLVVAAAGNSGVNADERPNYPSGFNSPSVVAVAATEDTGKFASFTNYGPTAVDLAAPGYKVLSTVTENKYKELSGTSMASPMVAGVAALILSVHPALNVVTLRNALFNGTVKQAAFAGKVSSAGELRADVALSQFNGGFQVWPKRAAIRLGHSMQFSTWAAPGTVQWSVDNPAVASVDNNGMLLGLTEGSVKLTAMSQGQSITTEAIPIRKVVEKSGGLCAPSAPRHANAGDFFNLGMPLFVGFMIRFRRRRTKRKA